MSFHCRCLFGVTALLALATNACSATTARVARVGEEPLQCPGGVIHTEADAASYAGCTTVEGDLKVESSQLYELNALESLRSVSGALIIAKNKKLISLHGLNGLTRAGSVQIRNNRLLCAQLGFLPQLGEVSDALVLSSNPSVTKSEVLGLLVHVKAPFRRPAASGREVALH